jgi:hypothetical protein
MLVRSVNVWSILWESVTRFFFANDIFISYSRLDASQYALALASRLSSFTCYLDQFGTQSSEGLPKTLTSIIRKSTVLVLLQSDGAVRSAFVREEVNLFRQTGRPIIPIQMEGSCFSATWMKDLRGLPVTDEKTTAWKAAVPSAAIVTRIEQSFTYTRRSQRVRRSVLASIGVVLLSLSMSAWSTVNAARTGARSRAMALAAQKEAQINKEQAAAANREAQHAASEAAREQVLANARARIAAERLIDLDQEHGRLDLISGDPTSALPYLVNAYASRSHDDSLGFLLTRAFKDIPVSIELQSN